MKKTDYRVIRKIFMILIIINLSFIAISCKKTYEEGANISLLSKKTRITGKWKLSSIQVFYKDGSEDKIEYIKPDIDMYMKFTREKVSNNYYKAEITNLHKYSIDESAKIISIEVELGTFTGTWSFFGPEWWCRYKQELMENEGLRITHDLEPSSYKPSLSYKIIRLTNKELILFPCCPDWELTMGTNWEFCCFKFIFKKE